MLRSATPSWENITIVARTCAMFERPAEPLFRIMLATFAHVLSRVDWPRVEVWGSSELTAINFNNVKRRGNMIKRTTSKDIVVFFIKDWRCVGHMFTELLLSLCRSDWQTFQANFLKRNVEFIHSFIRIQKCFNLIIFPHSTKHVPKKIQILTLSIILFFPRSTQLTF